MFYGKLLFNGLSRFCRHFWAIWNGCGWKKNINPKIELDENRKAMKTKKRCYEGAIMVLKRVIYVFTTAARHTSSFLCVDSVCLTALNRWKPIGKWAENVFESNYCLLGVLKSGLIGKYSRFWSVTGQRPVLLCSKLNWFGPNSVHC